MAASTVTVTAAIPSSPSEAPLCLPLRLRPHPSALAAIEKLAQLYETFRSEKDPLSREIRRWCKGVSQIDLSSSTFSAELIEQLGAKVKELLFTVLINPLDPTRPLQKPLLANGWVWEESFLQEYRSLIDKSPFPPFAPFEEATPHLFAREMLAWTETLPEMLLPHAAASITPPLPEIVADSGSKLTTYCLLAKHAAKTFASREERRAVKKLSDMAEEVQQRLQREMEERLKKTAEECRLSERRIEARIGHLEATHASTVSLLASQNDHLAERLHQTEAELREQEQIAKSQAEQIAGLRARIQSQQNEIAGLANQDSDSCVIL